jgi:serine/threonine protein kinase
VFLITLQSLSDEWSDTLDTIYESRGREHDSEEPEDEKGSTKCENILSFYDAFVDGNGGYIHLVVEYMDGGSLQDMVLQGGCQDESVLADISYQVLKVLCVARDQLRSLFVPFAGIAISPSPQAYAPRYKAGKHSHQQRGLR